MARHAPEFEPAGEDLEAIDLGGEDVANTARRVRHRFEPDDGDDPDERRWSTRRRWTVGVVVALVAITSAVVMIVNRDSKSRDVTLDVPTTDAATPPPPTVDAPPRIGATVRALPVRPFVVAGSGGVLLVDRRRPAARRLAPALSSDATVVDRVGSIVIVDSGRERVVVDASGDRPTVSQGNADVFVARRGNDAWSTAGRSLRAVYRDDVRYDLPAGHVPIAEVDGGFLLRTPRASLAVWSPRGKNLRSIARRVQHVVAVRPDRVAWTGADCAVLRCPLHLTDVATGVDTIVGAPDVAGDRGGAATEQGGRFSPDGRYLALMTPNRNGASSGVSVVDLTTGTARRLYSVYGALRMTTTTGDTARPLPFDWSPDGRTLVAIVPGDTFSTTRLAVIDPASGNSSESGDSLPLTTSLVSLGVAPSTQAAPPLPAARPLLGEPTGITLVNVLGTEVERLDLDTGRVTRTALASERAGTTATDQQTGDLQVVTLADGVLVRDAYLVTWVPRTGAPRSLGGATSVLGENRERAWLVTENETGTSLTPVDGHTGATGSPISVFTSPAGAVTDGFVEAVGPTFDSPVTLAVWRPTTHARRPIDTGRRTGVYVMASAGDHIVWTGYCRTDQFACGVGVTDVTTGTTREYGDWSVRTLSLAPDGSAAVFVPMAGDGAGTPQYLDLASGTVAPLPGANGVGGVVWAPGGWVFYSTDEPDALAAWRPGLAQPRAVPGVLSVFGAAAAI